MSQISNILEERYPNNFTAQSHFGELLSAYQGCGLAPPHLLQELATGEEGKFWAHMWEALLYHHLSGQGFEFRRGAVTKAGQRGPDFGIIHEDRTIWIEAVTTSPEGLPTEHLTPPRRGEFKTLSMPHEQMLLRWTSALKYKRDKLAAYVKDEVIPATDCTAIAVNGCRLSYWQVDDLGISQLPFAVEAVFPVGPIAVQIGRDGRIAGQAAHTTRFAIRKSNGADVPTGNFLDPLYANVGAVLGCTRSNLLNGGLSLSVVHNPLATAPVPVGILGAAKEYVAEDDGDDYLLRFPS
jgi:type I restriction enzyme S subunit